VNDILLASYLAYLLFRLAIARIFRGFPNSFFETYHEYHPQTEPVDQYSIRQDLYEVFHYLNHTLLFGVSTECKRGRMITVDSSIGWLQVVS
jgi:fructosamine-3-kinase